MIAVKNLMQAFRSSCTKEDKLSQTLERMASCSIRCLPGVDENDKVIGVVKYETVFKHSVTTKSETEMLIKEVMNEAIVINSYEDEACALLLMRQHHSNFLPVVDEEDHLKGIISFMTLARGVIQHKREVEMAFVDEAC